MERIRSGNAELDAILDGGFPANAIHIVIGSPGSGKTILAEQLAFENGTSERPALYLTTFSEPLPKFVAFLQDTNPVAFATMMQAILDGRPFAQAVESAYHLDVEALWLRFLRLPVQTTGVGR